MNGIDLFWSYVVLIAALVTSVVMGAQYGAVGAGAGVVLGGVGVIVFARGVGAGLGLYYRLRPRWPVCPSCGAHDWRYQNERDGAIAWKCDACQGDFLYASSSREFSRVLPDSSAQPVATWSLLGGWRAKAPTNGEAHG